MVDGDVVQSIATTRYRSTRNGFTLVELLVVIAILAVLVSLLLPAVNSARESARRTICVNHLSQTGMAVLNFESAKMYLPPGGYAGLNRRPTVNQGSYVSLAGLMYSWTYLVLPFMENSPVAEQFDLQTPVMLLDPNPAEIVIPTFVCPSDQDGSRIFRHPIYTRGRSFAKGNYAAFVSPFHVDLQYEFPGALGKFGQELKDITDGISKTLLASEVRTRDNALDQRGAWGLPWNAASVLAIDSHHDFRVPYRWFKPDEEVLDAVQRPNSPNVDPIYDCDKAAQAQLVGMPCATWTAEGVAGYLSSAPRSQHPGGVNAVFLDRRVVFLPDSIDPKVFALLVSVNDHQTNEIAGY